MLRSSFMKIDALTPKEMVSELDKYIVGQIRAKKAVAIALRNRIRRRYLPKDLLDEVAPKNIIMIGPTGVGKTEIARRISKITKSPFIKVEATKFTEVGYVGRDVESMIRDLMTAAVSMVRKEMYQTVYKEAEKRTEEALLDLLLPSHNKKDDAQEQKEAQKYIQQQLKGKKLENSLVEIQIQKNNMPTIEVFTGGGMEEMDFNIGGIGNILGMQKKRKKVPVKRARQYILQEEIDKLIDPDQVSEVAKDRVENFGIIFIDEIDKIAIKSTHAGPDVSREGVQRDILPIIEGSKVNTKYGVVDTSHILFISAGAFNISKPSDLIPELQGRFPIKVKLDALDENDFYRILTEPKNSLLKQYKELLAVEEVTLDFKDEAIRYISQTATEVNARTENIGARRLHAIIELLLEEVSFNAADLSKQTILITVKYVKEKLQQETEEYDLGKYIL